MLVNASGEVVAHEGTLYHIHQGLSFVHCERAEGLADDAAITLLLRTTAQNTVHLRAAALSAARCRLQIFENPTVNADGTARTPVNRNRRSTFPAGFSLFFTPTLGGDGTSLVDLDPAQVASVQALDELVLKASEDYLLRLTNLSGGAADATLRLEAYSLIQV
jgi:hypothetical protein